MEELNHNYRHLDENIIRSHRQEIIDSLEATKRKGIENVIKFMDDGDFFNLPSSDRNHHNWRGGLAQHVLEVMHNALMSYPKLPHDSITIAALLHDLCKIDQFKINDDGKIVRLNPTLKGHGRKSLQLLKDLGLEMNPEEERAILYHMRSMRPQPDDEPGLQEARKDSLWWAIRKSDGLSAKTNGKQ